jgi:hypothetical protein
VLFRCRSAQARARQNMIKTRQADLLMRLYSIWGDESLQKAAWTIGELKFRGYDDFVKKYAPGAGQSSANVAVFRVGWLDKTLPQSTECFAEKL